MKFQHNFLFVVSILVFAAVPINGLKFKKTVAEPINGINGSVIFSCQVDTTYKWCTFKHGEKVELEYFVILKFKVEYV